MGIRLKKFSHYTFNAGENKGEPVTFLSKSELSRALNIEQRGKGIVPRFGSSVLTVNGDGYPDPIDATVGNKADINSGYCFSYGDGEDLAIYTLDDKIYKNDVTPTLLTSGMTANLKWQFAQTADVLYLTNGDDDVRYFQPDRSVTQTYTSGYDTPAAFTAAEGAAGVLVAGTYEYYVTLYDSETLTESNRQLLAVSVTIAASKKVDLTNLPLDPESRTTHWRIYRKDTTGYYHYDLVEIPYDAGSPIYTDNIAATGRTFVAPNDNDRPDVSKSICLHGKTMLYGINSVLSWSKPYRAQNVPTYNRELLEEEGTRIMKIVSFKGAAVVFKERAIYVATGDFVQGSINLKRISKSVGTYAPDSVQVAPEGIFFFGSDGRPRLITPTDFEAEDLRDSSDISYKYTDKFEDIDPLQYENVFAVLWDYRRWSQYRLFVPINVVATYTNEVFAFDMGLASRNGGDSAWFTFGYNINAKCAWIQRESVSIQRVNVGDDYSLLWKLDVEDTYFDGDEFVREEDDGTVTFGLDTVQISTAAMEVDQFLGMQLILYDAFTFNEIFRSRIVSNTADTFTCEDVLPDLPTDNPYITVGGYLTYFGTAGYTDDRAGRCRPFALSLLLGQDVGEHDIFVFVNYDFNDQFNYTYDYINNPDNASATPRGDIYQILVGQAFSTYDFSLYDDASYGSYLYDTAEFPLRNKYLFTHASWGIITRAPSKPFLYLGGSMFYQYKALTRPNVPS